VTFTFDKNLKEKFKMLVHPREAWDQVMDARGSVDCYNLEGFKHHVEAFEVVCTIWLILFNI